MKKIVLVLMIALMGTVVTNAQPPQRHGMGKGQGIEQRIEKLEKALELTAEQKAEITKIFNQEKEAMGKGRPDKMENGKTPDRAEMEAFRSRLQAQREATDAKIESVLTPEQVAKYAELKAQRERKDHGPRHKGPRGKSQKGPRQGCDCNCDCSCKSKQ